MAGIDLSLGDDKYIGLINVSISMFIKGLGKRLKYVNIINDGSSVRVMPKTWVRKRIWREINDILRLHGFTWMSYEKNGF